MTKSTWGGHRPNSGRKPSPVRRKQMTIYVLPEVAEKLRAIAKARKTMVGRIIEELLKKLYTMTDFKTKMAELAAKYNISHKRDIDWHNFVYEVEELKDGQPMPDCAELIKSSWELNYDIDFCIVDLLRARKEGSEQHECDALSRMESLMVQTQQQLGCIIDYLSKEDKK